MTKEAIESGQVASGSFFKIALTGGPSGGKSTLIRAVEQDMSDVHCAPEVATMLLSGGFPTPSEAHPWTEAWQRSFQTAVAAGQLALEDVVLQRAMPRQTLMFDRGLLDGAAYLPGGVSELEQLTGLRETTMLERYDMVLHLATSAAHDAYDKHSNPHRLEEADAALALEAKVLTAWQNHPNRIILDNPDKVARLAQGLQIVSQALVK